MVNKNNPYGKIKFPIPSIPKFKDFFNDEKTFDDLAKKKLNKRWVCKYANNKIKSITENARILAGLEISCDNLSEFPENNKNGIITKTIKKLNELK